MNGTQSAGIANGNELVFDEIWDRYLADDVNPLIEAAHPLLLLAPRLRGETASMPVEDLRRRLAGMMEAFIQGAANRHVEKRTVTAASYCLCTFLDETIAATAWGADGVWSSHSLLVMFHAEASGGERFFAHLHNLSEDPAGNVDILELLYILLALGMEGRYRLIADGKEELESIRRNLRQLIRTVRGVPERALSPPWEVHDKPRWRSWGKSVLPWMSVGLVAMLALFFLSLDHRLGKQADQVLDALEEIHVPKQTSHGQAPLTSDWGRQLTSQLATEIAGGLLDVHVTTNRASIVLRSDALFASGSANVVPAYEALIRHLGDVLRAMPGHIVVIGHTDDQPPSSGGPSNWQLSLARANSIAMLLRAKGDAPDRFLIQGHGDTEPIASNATPSGQARNRRVTITVLAPGVPL